MDRDRRHAQDREMVIVARGLEKRFGDFTAVAGIDFEMRRGEIFGFLGPNGSGKTTTIRMILGLMPPTRGEVEVLGTPVHRHPERIRPRIGYMSQRFSLYNDLTVEENLRFYGRAYGLKGETLSQRIQEALRMSGLRGRQDQRTRDLSGGWRQRLALSAAVLHRPELLILDEPTAGVDPVSRRAFWDLLYEFITGGRSVFVTTHYMDEAEHCHRLAFLQRGQIVILGAPSEIKRQGMPGQVLEVLCDDAGQAVDVLRKARETGRLPLGEVALYGARVHVVTPRNTDLRADLARELRRAGLRVGPVTPIEPSLEDVFIANLS